MSKLLSPEDVKALLQNEHSVVLDVRSGANGAGLAAYEAGHIPGARHTDYAADGWRQKVGDVPGLLPDTQHLEKLFSKLGLRPDQAIIIAPEGKTANDFAAAARIYWTLKVAGYTLAGLLDGGTERWVREGYPVETGAPPSSHQAAPVRFDFSARADADAVLAAMARRETLVDGRSASYFRGDEKADQAKAYGHIPGAINIDYASGFDAALGRLKPVDQLREIYRLPVGPVVSYCNTGHTAAFNWFVLSEVLGRDVKLYDGSMTDWTQDAAHPVARSGS